jgi:hypothetical protein
VISGNDGSGVLVWEWVKVQGNLIGTSADGTANVGNEGNGVQVDFAAHNNDIGGLAGGEGNTIAFNGEAGIAFIDRPPSLMGSNAIRGNSIHSNQGLGIDIGRDGPTQNDDGDVDAGPNDLQNFPVLSGGHHCD